jgi:hypothetical protein
MAILLPKGRNEAHITQRRKQFFDFTVAREDNRYFTRFLNWGQ